jgi:acetylglutamate kinase
VEQLSILKIGGKVIDDLSELEIFLKGFASVPGRKILVHGGGKWVSDMSRRLGVEVKMTNGRRITDGETLEVVKMILPGLANKNIIALLQKYECNAIGLTGADGNTILALKRPVKDGIDFGYVGDITEIKIKNIHKLLDCGFVPVFTAMTHDGHGQLFNTNADTIASSLAVALSSTFEVELYYCFEKPGVLADLSDENSIIGYINSLNYGELQHSGIIHSGMLPKVDNAFEAIRNGVKRVHICHYKDIHKLTEGNSEIGTVISE